MQSVEADPIISASLRGEALRELILLGSDFFSLQDLSSYVLINLELQDFCLPLINMTRSHEGENDKNPTERLLTGQKLIRSDPGSPALE